MKHRNRIPNYLSDFVGGNYQVDGTLDEVDLCNILAFYGVNVMPQNMSKKAKKILSEDLKKKKKQETKKTIMTIIKKMSKNNKTNIKFL